MKKLLAVLVLVLATQVSVAEYNTYYGFRGGMSMRQAMANAEAMGAVLADQADIPAAHIAVYNGGRMQRVMLTTTILFFDRESKTLISVAFTPTAWESMPTLESANERVRAEAISFGQAAKLQPDYWYDDDGTLNARFYVNGMKVHISAMTDKGEFALGLFIFFKEGKNT